MKATAYCEGTGSYSAMQSIPYFLALLLRYQCFDQDEKARRKTDTPAPTARKKAWKEYQVALAAGGVEITHLSSRKTAGMIKMNEYMLIIT
jgi:hypothetical protein